MTLKQVSMKVTVKVTQHGLQVWAVSQQVQQSPAGHTLPHRSVAHTAATEV